MDFTAPSDIAAIAGLIVMVLTVFSWLIRRWIKDQIETEIEQHLKNDEMSVTSCAHEALDAANAAGKSALAAKTAALDAKSAALSAADAARSAENAINSLHQEGKQPECTSLTTPLERTPPNAC
jgi:hypothetical protein